MWRDQTSSTVEELTRFLMACQRRSSAASMASLSPVSRETWARTAASSHSGPGILTARGKRGAARLAGMRREQRHGRGRDAFDPRGLTKRARPNQGEFRPDLVRQAVERCKIEIVA